MQTKVKTPHSRSFYQTLIEFNRNYRILVRTRHFFARLLQYLFFLKTPSKWSVAFLSDSSGLFYRLKYQNQVLRLLCNNEIMLYRASTFHDKEPETNSWIEAMPTDGVFFDVGANVGIFSVMAAMRCRKVYAFEPVYFNYSVLNQNLLANNLASKVTAYCLAVGNKTELNTMRLSSNAPGSAHHTFGADMDVCHKSFVPVFNQGSLSVSLDDLVYQYGLECPTYLKIDVDGNENLIVTGASKLFRDSRLQSILIELNKDLAVDIDAIKTITSYGFVMTESGEESLIAGHKVGNVIFNRAH